MEQHKVFSRRRRSSAKLFLLFHLAPVLVTVSLVALHALAVKWAPNHPTSEELALLQFAAKIHETLVILSLTKVLAHRILYLMVHDEGTPFGFLTSSFQLTSPVYLFTSEFWAPLARRGSRSPSWHVTVILIIVSFLLAAGAGPFSAILVIPRLQWWQMDGDDAVLRDLTATINRKKNFLHPVDMVLSSPESFYPLSVGMDSAPDASADPEPGLDSLPGSCGMTEGLLCFNSMGFADIKDSLLQMRVSTPEPPNFLNVSLSTRFSRNRNKPIAATGRLTGTTTPRAEMEESMAIVTTPLDLATADITLRSQVLREDFHREDVLVNSEPVSARGSASWKQPVVGVHCRHNITGAGMYAPDAVSFAFRDWLYPAFTLTLHMDDELKPIRDYLSRPFNQSPRVMPTVMLGGGSGIAAPDQRVSNVVVFTNGLLYPASYENGVFLMTVCVVKAFWARSDIWVQPPAIYPPQFSLDIPPEDLMATTRDTTDGIIGLESDWLSELDKLPLNGSAYEELQYSCMNGTVSFQCTSVGLATFLADAISRIWPTQRVNNTGGSPVDIESLGPDATLISSRFFRYVYGYGFSAGSTSQVLAFIVLLSHVVIVLLHLVVTSLVAGTGPSYWSSNAWPAAGDWIALALGSEPPSLLRNAGASAGGGRVWQSRARIGESRVDGRPELRLQGWQKRSGSAGSSLDGESNTELNTEATEPG